MRNPEWKPNPHVHHRRTQELFKKLLADGLRCTCGWPAEHGGNVHSPDCDWELEWIGCHEQAEQEQYDAHCEAGGE